MAVTYSNPSLSLPRDSCSLPVQIVPSIQLEVHRLQVQCNGGDKHICDRNISQKVKVFTFTKSESDSSLIFIAVIQSFVSVLEEGSMPKVLATNVSKFIISLYIAVKDL